MFVLLASNRLLESDAPGTHAPLQVYSLRVAWLVAKSWRRRWAAPPFSTMLPSGASLAEGGLPRGSNAQKFEGVVQKLVLSGRMKPLTVSSTPAPLRSARMGLPFTSS